jgi:hypothetical protein
MYCERRGRGLSPMGIVAACQRLPTRPKGPKVLKTLLRSPPALLRPSGEKTLDPHQHELVVVRPLQRRPDLT